MASITCYDGVETIGGNKILLEDGAAKLWLDFGLDFGRMGRFYEEYLKPKSCLGLYEPIQMGLLPPIRDLYRADLVSGLADPWAGIDAQTLGNVDGVLLSHAHLDHLGALSYVRGDIPVYSSAMTLAVAKATQDSGVGGVSGQYCYTCAYEATDSGELRAVPHSRGPSRARPFVLVDQRPGEELIGFWNSTPGSLSERGRRHEPSEIAASSTCGGLKLRRFPIDHSVYGACAWAIETSGGWVVYTGDLRCHGRRADLTWKFAEEVGRLKPRALVIEGTRIESEGTCTEDEVRDRALREVRAAEGLVVADFGPRNVERLASFLDIARETGRKLLLLPKDVYLLEKMALTDDEVPSPDDSSVGIYCKYEVSTVNWRKLLRETYTSKLVQPWEVAGNQDKMVCCFSFFDVNELAYIKPVPGSLWLYSSCEPFNEEMRMDAERLREWADLHKMALPADPTEDENSPFHVSGHACRSDLLKLIDIIRPQTVIPVHTEQPQLYAEALKGKCDVVLPERGVGIEV
ncbi:MAG: exonuclease [Gemmatimonadales bacterium]|nr:exonuclease [Gemmatimonadales bacterium]